MSATSPPALPINAGTATKAAFTVGAALAIAAPAVAPYSPAAAGVLVSLGIAAIGIGGVIHSYWDHSP